MKLVTIELIMLPMALEGLIILGLGYLVHVRLVIAMRAVRPMVMVIAVASVEETMRLTMATSRWLESPKVSTLKEGVATSMLVLNLGRSILMVQRIDIRDTRLRTLQTLEDVIIVTERHHHLDVVECL